MPTELNNELRRALGLAVQLLADLPEWLRPESDMDDMRMLLAGGSTGRDGYIIAQALATALVYRTRTGWPCPEAAYGTRMAELTALLAATRHVDPQLLAISWHAACERQARP